MVRFNTVILSWYSSDKLEYVSMHTQHNAPKDRGGWVIKKLIWSGSLLVRVEELVGIHNERAQLGWMS